MNFNLQRLLLRVVDFWGVIIAGKVVVHRKSAADVQIRLDPRAARSVGLKRVHTTDEARGI